MSTTTTTTTTAPIGCVAGELVYADADDLGFLLARLELGGWAVATDGRTFLRLARPASDAEFDGDLTIADWRALVALVHCGAVDALIALAAQQ